MKSICVFCGSNSGDDPRFAEAARDLAKLFVQENIHLVYGGANVGLMGLIADSILEQGGKAIGVIPASLFPKEIPHQGLTQLHVVRNMHERKQLMYDLSDAFIALPGGLGTLEELCEILTWAQLGLHNKPCGILNVNGYFKGILQFFEAAIHHEFMKPEHKNLIIEDKSAVKLLEKFRAYHPQPVKKWMALDKV